MITFVVIVVVVCKNELMNSFTSSLFVFSSSYFKGSLLLVGCILAYKTKDLDHKYGEASQLGTLMI